MRLRVPLGRLRTRKTPETDAGTADTVLRLAVLLQAGIPPARAWVHLAEAGDTAAMRVAAAVEDGVAPSVAMAGLGGSWPEVASAWTIAQALGAPLAESLRGIALAVRDARETADDVRVALAEPAGTARLMAWLPLVAVLMGSALGFDTVAVFVGNPLGLVCLAAGAALMLGARRWNAALVRSAGRAVGIPGIDAELLAIGLSGGASIERARTILEAELGPVTDPAVEETLTLSRRAGVPAVELLRASASLRRHRARVDGRLRAARLSSKLLLPLGVCILPAFLLLGVAPMLLSVLDTASISL